MNESNTPTPTMPEPPGAQKTEAVRVLSYSSSARLTLSIYPWPTGIGFPGLPLNATKSEDWTATPTIFKPQQTVTWNNEQIIVAIDGHKVKIGAVDHDPITEGVPLETTSSAVSTPPSVSTKSTSSSQMISRPVESTSTPENTSTPITSAQPNSGNNGISGGAVAGVAIGCLLAGALITGLIAFLYLKRRKSPPRNVSDSEASTVALMHREKGTATNVISISSGSPVTSALENSLPQPLEDKAISGEISKISNLIKNHVQSYYHTRPVNAGMIDIDDIQALGQDLPVPAGTLSTLLNNAATREFTLRFCIAWIVTSCIQLNSSSNTSFLPPEVSRSLQTMGQPDRVSRNHAFLFTKWRALTAELLQSSYVRDSFSADDGRNRNIQAAASTLDSVLRPFADSRMDHGARMRNLEEILKRSAQFALTLFSQPASWSFDWQDEQDVRSGNLCIFPALVQIADEHGQSLNPPRPFSEAVNRRLDE